MSHFRTLSVAIGLIVIWIALSNYFPSQGVASPPGGSGSNGLLKDTSPQTVTHQIEIGAFLGVSPPTAAAVNEFEDLTGRHMHSVMWYQGWDASGQPSFPCADLLPVQVHDGFRSDITFHVTWEPWVNLADIANGVYDAYLTSYATEVKSCGLKTRLRFAHEMIQNDIHDNCQGQANCPEWYPWQDQPTDYIAAFRHVHDAFMTAGATNVEFVWCPNNYPFDLSILQKYFPGQNYVDWLCMDGYNWTNQDGQPGWPDWQWFDDIFYSIYHTFVEAPDIFGNKPIMIGEFASGEAGSYELPEQTKPAWINNTFERIRSSDYAQIQAFYWFHINKELDWRVSSSPDSLSAFQAAISNSQFTSHSMPVYLPLVVKGP
jgi:hypothetical protein